MDGKIMCQICGSQIYPEDLKVTELLGKVPSKNVLDETSSKEVSFHAKCYYASDFGVPMTAAKPARKYKEGHINFSDFERILDENAPTMITEDSMSVPAGWDAPSSSSHALENGCIQTVYLHFTRAMWQYDIERVIISADVVMPVLFDIPAYTASGTILTGVIRPYGLDNANACVVSSFQGPATQTDNLIDMYTIDTPHRSGVLRIMRNGRCVGDSIDINTINSTDNLRVHMEQSIVFHAGDLLCVSLTLS